MGKVGPGAEKIAAACDRADTEHDEDVPTGLSSPESCTLSSPLACENTPRSSSQ